MAAVQTETDLTPKVTVRSIWTWRSPVSPPTSEVQSKSFKKWTSSPDFGLAQLWWWGGRTGRKFKDRYIRYGKMVERTIIREGRKGAHMTVVLETVIFSTGQSAQVFSQNVPPLHRSTYASAVRNIRNTESAAFFVRVFHQDFQLIYVVIVFRMVHRSGHRGNQGVPGVWRVQCDSGSWCWSNRTSAQWVSSSYFVSCVMYHKHCSPSQGWKRAASDRKSQSDSIGTVKFSRK